MGDKGKLERRIKGARGCVDCEGEFLLTLGKMMLCTVAVFFAVWVAFKILT